MLTFDDLIEIIQPIDVVEQRLFHDTMRLLDIALPLPPTEGELHEDVEHAITTGQVPTITEKCDEVP